LEGEHVAVLLKDLQPSATGDDSLYLRYAITRQGVETPIFPALVLDDWGSEIRGQELYLWLHEFGDQFPRAELFGFGLDGREVQCFLREVDLHIRLPCYAYREKDASLRDGFLVEALALPDDSLATTSSSMAVRIRPPAALNRPLRSAQVSWWRVNPSAPFLHALFS
jgi:hypothetical protein